MRSIAERRQRLRDLLVLRERVVEEIARERRGLHTAEASKRSRAVVPVDTDSATVRAWARENGWPDLGTRGRIPADAIDAYLEHDQAARMEMAR